MNYEKCKFYVLLYNDLNKKFHVVQHVGYKLKYKHISLIVAHHLLSETCWCLYDFDSGARLTNNYRSRKQCLKGEKENAIAKLNKAHDTEEYIRLVQLHDNLVNKVKNEKGTC